MQNKVTRFFNHLTGKRIIYETSVTSQGVQN